MSYNDLLEVLKDDDDMKHQSSREISRVQGMSLSGKEKYAINAAAKIPLYENAIKFQGEVILDQKIENDLLKEKLQLTETDEQNLTELANESKNRLTRAEKDSKILQTLKAKVNQYRKEGIYADIGIVKSDKPLLRSDNKLPLSESNVKLMITRK
jgi:hypothetical protein